MAVFIRCNGCKKEIPADSPGSLELREIGPGILVMQQETMPWHFCGVECVVLYFAKREPASSEGRQTRLKL